MRLPLLLAVSGFLSFGLSAAGAVDVRECGAVGDGGADDTAAIQRGVDQAATSGGVVTIPPGTYRVTKPIKLPSRIRLEGASTESTKLVAPQGVDFDLIEIRDADSVSVTDLTLEEKDRVFDGKGAGLHIAGKSRGIIVEGVVVRGFGAGFRLARDEGAEGAQVSTVTLRDCRAEEAKTFGFELNNCRQVLLDNCSAFRHRLDGIKLRRQTQDVTIRGGVSSNNGHNGPNGNGVDAYAGGSSFVIRDLLVEENNGSGIYIKTGPLNDEGYGEVGRGLISDVIARNNISSGLDINRSGGDLPKPDKKKLPPLASHFVIVGGLYESNERNGIYVRGRNISMIAPIVRANARSGINLSSAWDVQISGALISGNGASEPGKFSGIEIGFDEVKGIARRIQVRDSIINGIDDSSQQSGDAVTGAKPLHAHAIAVSSTGDEILLDGNVLLNWTSEGAPVRVEAGEAASVVIHYGNRPEVSGPGSPGSTLRCYGRIYVKASPAAASGGWGLSLSSPASGKGNLPVPVGEMRFHEKTGKPIWWNGSEWVDAKGVASP